MEYFNLVKTVFGLSISALLFACGSGNTGPQNIPYGGTPFTGVFMPGIGNLSNGSGIDTCSTQNAESETLFFTVNESGATLFIDDSLQRVPYILQGNFINPVNQNNPCFTGGIAYSACSYAQSGTINFKACTSNLFGSGYLFTAIYYLYAKNGDFIQQGTVSATK